jgi:hypothetical protein
LRIRPAGSNPDSQLNCGEPRAAWRHRGRPQGCRRLRGSRVGRGRLPRRVRNTNSWIRKGLRWPLGPAPPAATPRPPLWTPANARAGDPDRRGRRQVE